MAGTGARDGQSGWFPTFEFLFMGLERFSAPCSSSCVLSRRPFLQDPDGAAEKCCSVPAGLQMELRPFCWLRYLQPGVRHCVAYSDDLVHRGARESLRWTEYQALIRRWEARRLPTGASH